MYERTLALELPLAMFEEIDQTIDELYAGVLSAVYDSDKCPPVKVGFIYKGVVTQIEDLNNLRMAA